MKTIDQRFWAKVERADADACWLWMGSTIRNGYGNIRGPEGRNILAHRYAYEALRTEIPTGLVLDHLCRERRCVNPWHLEPVTSRVNTMRGSTIAAAHAAKTHCVNGHELSGSNVAIDSHGWRRCLTCRAINNAKQRSV